MWMMVVHNDQTMFHFQQIGRHSSELVQRVRINKHRQIGINRDLLIRRRDAEVFH
jgi:hypothetical protein